MKKCSVSNCLEKIHARDLCLKHYSRWRCHGTTDKFVSTLEERFLQKVEKIEHGCWIWKASKNSRGYGSINSGTRGTCGAHRISFELFKGPIPHGLCVLHRCDVRACVNPDHLFIGDHKANTADMISKGRAIFVNGERHGKSKLTESQVRKIRADNRPMIKIAKEYRIAQPNVWAIKHRKLWKHVI